MCKIAPPGGYVHFPESERQRHRRAELSSLKKYKLDKWLTVYPVWEESDD